MRTIKAIELAKTLGIARRTVAGWCAADPKLAFKRNGVYYIRVSELARRPGFDLVSALTLTNSRWIKAISLAAVARRPRRTIANWCANRPRFAKRVGRVWYVDLEALGATDEQVETLRRWAPQQRTAIEVLSAATFLNKVMQ